MIAHPRLSQEVAALVQAAARDDGVDSSDDDDDGLAELEGIIGDSRDQTLKQREDDDDQTDSDG